jgi:hypothetical protein
VRSWRQRWVGACSRPFTYDPYGQVIAHEHLHAHAWLRAGHKGLFVDRLDAGVANSANDDLPRLVAGARLQYYMRNRTLDAWLGRALQQDPNATGVTLVLIAAHDGVALSATVDQFNLQQHFRDGANLYQYLRGSPWTRSDPLGLYDWEEEENDNWGEWFVEELFDGLNLLRPIPGPSDFIRESLKAMLDDYAENLMWDIEWALDWSLPDDHHSRMDNAWIGAALGRGLYNAFEIGLPGTDRTVNPLDWFAGKGKSRNSGAGGSKPRGGYTIHVQRGQQAHRNYRNALGSGYQFEVSIQGVGRVDAIDFKAKKVRELKPDTASGRARGDKQLRGYVERLNAHPEFGGGWTGYLDLYRP